MRKIIHIVEHFPKGTIYRLIEPLGRFKNQSVVYVPEDISNFNDLFNYNIDDIFIIHTTGRLTEIFLRCVELISKFSVYLFLHVSPSYMYFQKRYRSLEQMKVYYKHGIKFLSPCNAIKVQLFSMGIESNIIQLGIPNPNVDNKFSYLHKYNRKIITCCSEDTEQYFQIKGIDKFASFIIKNNLQEFALIVGIDKVPYEIESVSLSHDEFMYVLSKSRMYVQFSKYEAYNITAVEAKRLRIPVVVFNTEGIEDNILYGYSCKTEQEMTNNILSIFCCDFDKMIVENNYKDSINRESLENFAQDFNKLIEE